MRLTLLGIVLCAFSGAVGAVEIDLVVERLDEDAQRCGINTNDIESVGRLTLRNNGIQVNSSSRDYLYIAVLVLGSASSQQCVASLNLSFLVPAVASTKVFASKLPITAAVCEKHTVFAYSRSKIAEALGVSIERNIKLCLGQMTY